uniref:Uncharacterized protein n=1 Tax=Anguilla anguilla TaxID=7936 RepID=A0A0E9T045_ANGAN
MLADLAFELSRARRLCVADYIVCSKCVK